MLFNRYLEYSICLRCVFRFDVDDDIIDLYQTALENNPNEEWANHWFMALVRKGDFKAVQQVLPFN
jgi:hypothetical protein